MKDKVIFVDFINKSRKVTPYDKPGFKGFFSSLWRKLKKTILFTNKSNKTKSHKYNYKRTM
jgi:hypothetical protein